MPEFKLDMFLLGCCGGLLPDILRIIKNKTQPDVLDCFKEVKFWIILVLQVLLGGFAVYIMGTTGVKEALLIGFTAPEVIGSIVSVKEKKEEPAPPGVKAGGGKKKFKILAWLAN